MRNVIMNIFNIKKINDWNSDWYNNGLKNIIQEIHLKIKDYLHYLLNNNKEKEFWIGTYNQPLSITKIDLLFVPITRSLWQFASLGIGVVLFDTHSTCSHTNADKLFQNFLLLSQTFSVAFFYSVILM